MTIIQQSKRKTYSFDKSPLYKLSSKRKLANLLGIQLNELNAFLKQPPDYNYRIYRDKETRRFITEPISVRLKIHKSILKLISRISPPAYIHSAFKNRSYKTNAEYHLSGSNLFTIDIKKFFPSIQFETLHSYFFNKLKCSIDIATILAKLCTVRTKLYGVHLPTGSCISPILSFFVNQRLFNDIEQLCLNEGCAFSVYVDDITVSGENATSQLLNKIALKIHNAGYRYHKIKTFKATPATITGLIVFKGKLDIPHIRKKRIRVLMEALVNTSSPHIKQQILASLIGRLSEVEQVLPQYKNIRLKLLLEYSKDWQVIKDKRVLAQKCKFEKVAK